MNLGATSHLTTETPIIGHKIKTMNIETIEKGNELLKELKKLQLMQKEAVASKLFLSTVRKSYPKEVLEATALILRNNIQVGIDSITIELEAL